MGYSFLLLKKNFSLKKVYKNNFISNQVLNKIRCSVEVQNKLILKSPILIHQNYSTAQEYENVVHSPFREKRDFPNMTLPEFLEAKFEKFSKCVAIECGVSGRNYTYSQLQSKIRKFAVSLLNIGFKSGDVIGLISPNCPEFPIVVFGCLEAGLVITLINHTYTSDEIMKQLKDSGAVCVIAGAEQLETVKTAIDEMKLFSQDGIKLITLNMGKVNINSEGTVLFSDLVSDYVNSSELSVLRKKHSNPDDLAFLPYSSGTTGLPKGVMLSNKSVLQNLLQIGIPEITPFTETAGQHQEVVPAIIPFYHIYGLTLLMTQSLIFGSKIVTLPKFEPKLLLDTLKFQKCSILYFVPPLLLFLGSNEKVTSDYFKHVHTIVSGAAPMGESDIQRLLDKISVHNRISYVQGYGLTEASPVVTYPHKGNKNYSTVGSPLPNTILKVIDVESGKSLEPNQGGEICLKGPQVMLGYLNNITATASVIDKNGWLKTGDLGHYDEKGLFYITERIKELIKVKGFQVAPAELEEVLRSMPGIKDAGVFGMPDKKSGEVPIAFIVKSTKALSASDVKEFIFKKVAPFKQLSDVVFVETIPKSGSGKILRREMLKLYKDSKRN